MKIETVFLYTLNKTGEEVFAEVVKIDELAPLKVEIENFIECFWQSATPDKKGAEAFFSSEWKRISGGSPHLDIPRDINFDDLIEENRALNRAIPDVDDFNFQLENNAEVEKFLRDGPQTSQSLSQGGEHSWTVVAGAERLDEDEESFAPTRLNLNLIKHASDNTSNKFSFDQEIWLCEQGTAVKGRILACLCERGKKWSVSVRRTQKKKRPVSSKLTEPSPKPDFNYLNTTAAISDVIGHIIFGAESFKKSGLIVIAGRTGSAKSQIAKALIEAHLGEKANGHLLTYEDPIERPIKTKGAYTSREKGKDVLDLSEATHNALRQKPSVMFVGETRNTAEWNLLLDFAGTGHLVVTTSHAGSLIEAMGNILQAARAETPSARSDEGGKLLAVAHLKVATITARKSGREITTLIPALWHYSPEGVKELMSEGLSSIVPNTPCELSDSTEDGLFPSSIGRYWFAKELLERVTTKTAELMDDSDKEFIKTSALEWDLEGV